MSTQPRCEKKWEHDFVQWDLLRGDGKKQLLARALYWEKIRNHASDQYPNFAYAGVLIQIAIVVASVAIIMNNRMLLIGSGVEASFGALLALNGHFLFLKILSPGH